MKKRIQGEKNKGVCKRYTLNLSYGIKVEKEPKNKGEKRRKL